MSRILGISSGLLLLLAACAGTRTFACFRCARHVVYERPGEVPCRDCLTMNYAGRCPSCGHVEPQPAGNPLRCSACREAYFAVTCPDCASVSFARTERSPCPSCAAPPAAGGDGRVFRSAGDARAARGEWEAAAADYEAALRISPRDPGTRYALACALCRAGRTERALDALERAVADGFRNGELLRKDRDLEAVRADPRYLRLLEGLPR